MSNTPAARQHSRGRAWIREHLQQPAAIANAASADRTVAAAEVDKLLGGTHGPDGVGARRADANGEQVKYGHDRVELVLGAVVLLLLLLLLLLPLLLLLLLRLFLALVVRLVVPNANATGQATSAQATATGVEIWPPPSSHRLRRGVRNAAGGVRPLEHRRGQAARGPARHASYRPSRWVAQGRPTHGRRCLRPQ